MRARMPNTSASAPWTKAVRSTSMPSAAGDALRGQVLRADEGDQVLDACGGGTVAYGGRGLGGVAVARIRGMTW